MSDVLVSFRDERCLDVAIAGGKGASLAAMTAAGLPVPPGFAVPAYALEQSVDRERLLAAVHARDQEAATAVVREAEPPRAELDGAYAEIGRGAVAVRSSACAEDSEAASYAGQQETYLNVEGVEAVAARVVDCWASFFSERAIFYRAQKGSLDDLRMAVVVQRMVDPEKSGVVFTVDPVQRRRDRMLVEAVFGLGEQAVSGHVTPDHYVVDRAGAVVRERLVHGGVLSEEELVRLVAIGGQLEERFGGPQDIEWAIAGGELYLLQSRPVTTL
ncbi:MAG TPA: PEP/pyruvate-binding domain-containing protein [Gaiellaceae bacterium]|jgi:pyruvate,water dikinase